MKKQYYLTTSLNDDACFVGIKAVVGEQHPWGETYCLDNLFTHNAALSPTHIQAQEIAYRLLKLFKNTDAYLEVMKHALGKQAFADVSLFDTAYRSINNLITVLLHRVELHQRLRDIDAHLFGLEVSEDDMAAHAIPLQRSLGHHETETLFPLQEQLFKIRKRPESGLQTTLLQVTKVTGALFYVLGVCGRDGVRKQVAIMPSKWFISKTADQVAPVLIQKEQKWVQHPYPGYSTIDYTYHTPWAKKVVQLIDMLIEANQDMTWTPQTFAIEFLAWYLAWRIQKFASADKYVSFDESFYYQTQSLLLASEENHDPIIDAFIVTYDLPLDFAALHDFCEKRIYEHPKAWWCPEQEINRLLMTQSRYNVRNKDDFTLITSLCKELVVTFCKDIRLYHKHKAHFYQIT